ncbi:MAG: hypothetical protein AM325_009630 [Candidatus Thorarchaeota archaeon SMTZ1-45]|nr:MAG: hypothetical protein AM325_11010 [Candidatus Thorarchaeota archaeon SMTZ1-45]
MSSEKRIIEQLIEQFESSWLMLRQSIENVPDDKWDVGIEVIDKPWAEVKGQNIWYFSERIFHIIQTVEFYSSDEPEVMKWGGRIGGIDWRKESPQITASRIKKDDMIAYLEETKMKLRNKLRTFTDDDMFETDGFSKWQPSRLAKFLYTMRHSMWHIGELSRTLREWDCERLEWQ